jgi:hypothetical protein
MDGAEDGGVLGGGLPGCGMVGREQRGRAECLIREPARDEKRDGRQTAIESWWGVSFAS